jgi:hypothetical protein
MTKEISTYRGNKYYTLPLLVAPIVLLVPLLESGGPITGMKLFGYCLLSGISVGVALAPLGFKLEIGDDYVKTLFCGFCLRTLHASRIRVVAYGNLFRGGLGYGKGLNGWERLPSGRSKYFSIGEKAYGKEAIVHAKRVLESGLIKEKAA